MQKLTKYVALCSACSTLVICILVVFDLVNDSYRRNGCAKEDIRYVRYNSLKVFLNVENKKFTSDRHVTSKQIITHAQIPGEDTKLETESRESEDGDGNNNLVNKVHENLFDVTTENVTLVTAFWDIGYAVSRNQYEEWANVFKHIVNPLVVFTDSLEFQVYMNRTRKEFLRRTVIIIVNRMSLWPFNLVQQIQSVGGQPVYPIYHPRIVYSTYASTQHSKYVSVADAILNRYFQSPYYAWVDLDYFRDLDQKQIFRINAPKELKKNTLGMNIMKQNNQTFAYDDISNMNHDWISSGFIIGRNESFLKFEKLYHNAVLYFLDEELTNTDQHILKYLYSDEGRGALNPDVELQLFNPKGYVSPRYYLGFTCIEDV